MSLKANELVGITLACDPVATCEALDGKFELAEIVNTLAELFQSLRGIRCKVQRTTALLKYLVCAMLVRNFQSCTPQLAPNRLGKIPPAVRT